VKAWSDDEQLSWVRERAAGVSPAVIAAKSGANEAYVRAATNRIRTADIAESGENRVDVERAYWGLA
jgi:hypothetical protein